jgi:propionyl-CoA synthetase
LQAELVQAVRAAVGPIANFKRALVVPRLPKTRSGKILRQVIRKMIDGQEYSVPSTIDDPGIVDELHDTLAKNGWLS